jgi:clan AA aspartic protease
MITGVVTVDREAIVRLILRGPAGQETEIEAVIDTGYDGWLCLPTALIAQLELAWTRRGRAIMADGRECDFDIHEGIVIWDGQPYLTTVDAGEVIPLLGMSLLEGHELTLQVCLNGPVTIRALPSP